MERIDTLAFRLERSAVCLGKFDGIHRGHRLLLKKVCEKEGTVPTVFTLSMRPDAEKIYDQREKDRILAGLGIRREVVFPFDRETKNMLPEEFIREILVRRMDVRYICVGADFHFGKNRMGDVSTLEKFQSVYGYELEIVPKLREGDSVISSTLIREYMERGEIKKANRLLGEPYFIQGRVAHGQEIGRTLDFPTANLEPAAGKKLPRQGVYATTVSIGDAVFSGVTDVGTKPTVGKFSIGVETCILDFDGNLYGKEITVSFHDFLRDEVRFESVEKLREQIERDRRRAVKILTGQRAYPIIYKN